jgi:hypothetical protein
LFLSHPVATATEVASRTIGCIALCVSWTICLGWH